jgi:cytochrome b
MPAAESHPRLKVWDPLVRGGHWALAASVAAAWLTREGWGVWHDWTGYATLLLVAARIAWGWAGPRYARFAQFVHGPAETLRYAGRALVGSEPRYVGHNPLGAWMIVALLSHHGADRPHRLDIYNRQVLGRRARGASP